MKKRTYILLVICVMLLKMAGSASGITVVDAGGSGDYTTIQGAIDNVGVDGDYVIQVNPGTYYEDIDFDGEPIHLYSSGGPEVTTIDGTGEYHVVTCDSSEVSTTILEGFTITGGNADGEGVNANGGGMYIYSSSPTVIDCTFTGNSAANAGGGMYNKNSNPTLTDCVFTGNSATNGGGMYNDSAGPIMSFCEFEGNTATGSGPGFGGGGIHNNIASPSVINCIFNSNTTQGYGGGIFNHGDSPTVVSCLFTANTAQSSGGALANYGASAGMITNCTFWDNTTNAAGGGIRSYSSSPTVTNCIIWGNTPDEVSLEASGTVFTYCDINGGTGQPWFGTGCIDADPLFFDVLDDDFRLISSGSPCVDTGHDGLVTEPNDLAGNPRVFDGDGDGYAAVDMGAYELNFREVHNLTQDIWYSVIQTAIDEAVTADQIEVAPGSYNEALNFNGKAIELVSTDGPEVTTIDATDLNASVVVCNNSEGPDTLLQGFTLTGGIGTVIGSHRYGGGMYNEGASPTVFQCIFYQNSASGDGGGMYNKNNSSPAVTDCSFIENHANYAAGGMDNRGGSSPTVTGCTFTANTAGTSGGGMENYTDCSPTVSNCSFTGNIAAQWGGGMSNTENSGPTVTDCSFTDNHASSYDGGGVNNSTGVSTYTRCDFVANEANRYGGGVMNYNNPTSSYVDCTFTGNSSVTEGGGVMNWNGASTSFSRCTFSNNSSNYGGAMFNRLNSSPVILDCIFEYNTAAAWGGALHNYEGTQYPTIAYSQFLGNRANNERGGAIAQRCAGTLGLDHCLFIGNYAKMYAGGFYTDAGTTEMQHCTFTANNAPTRGGGILMTSSSVLTIKNTIVWGNTSPTGAAISRDNGTLLASYNDFGEAVTGDGNLTQDPNFIEVPNDGGDGWGDDPSTEEIDESTNDDFGNLRLSAGSPCIDAGSSFTTSAVDLDGNVRAVNDPDMTDIGIGPVTFLDMGAYEYNPCVIEGDINCDGKVDLLDMCMLSANWLQGV